MTAALAFVFSLTAFAWQGAPQSPTTADAPVVVTTGEGIVKKAPDRAWVTVAAESRAKTPQEAQKLNATAMSSVLQKLKAAGIAEEAIQTAAYDLQPEYDYHDGRQTLRGYVARNAVSVRVDTLPRLGEIIEMAVSSGATTIRGVRFDVQDRGKLERDALRLAVGDARQRANALAEGADMKVVSVTRIQEHGTTDPPRPMVNMMSMAGAEQLRVGGAPPIEGGELEIKATVTLTATIR